MKLVQLKMREARFWPKMKFEPIFFTGSLAVFQSKRVASAGGRGFGGNSASPEPKRSPAVLLIQSRTPQNSFLFLLEEKNRRAQIKKCEENFFAGWRGFRATAGLASLLGVLLKKSSNINQKTPPIFTFCEIVRNSLGAKRLGMVFFRNFEGIFEIQNQSAVGNAEVRRAKLWQNEILQTNLFSFTFSERLSVFFFDCPKTNFKTIWTT
jgi:hypothetical protein